MNNPIQENYILAALQPNNKYEPILILKNGKHSECLAAYAQGRIPLQGLSAAGLDSEGRVQESFFFASEGVVRTIKYKPRNWAERVDALTDMTLGMILSDKNFVLVPASMWAKEKARLLGIANAEPKETTLKCEAVTIVRSVDDDGAVTWKGLEDDGALGEHYATIMLPDGWTMDRCNGGWLAVFDEHGDFVYIVEDGNKNPVFLTKETKQFIRSTPFDMGPNDE